MTIIIPTHPTSPYKHVANTFLIKKPPPFYLLLFFAKHFSRFRWWFLIYFFLQLRFCSYSHVSLKQHLTHQPLRQEIHLKFKNCNRSCCLIALPTKQTNKSCLRIPKTDFVMVRRLNKHMMPCMECIPCKSID